MILFPHFISCEWQNFSSKTEFFLSFGDFNARLRENKGRPEIVLKQIQQNFHICKDIFTGKNLRIISLHTFIALL